MLVQKAVLGAGRTVMTKLNMLATNRKMPMKVPIRESSKFTGCAKIFHPMSNSVSSSPASVASCLHHRHALQCWLWNCRPRFRTRYGYHSNTTQRITTGHDIEAHVQMRSHAWLVEVCMGKHAPRSLTVGSHLKRHADIVHLCSATKRQATACEI